PSSFQGEAMTHMRTRKMIWTLAITSVALFMVSLDNLVVTTALPVIRRNLDASISQLEWTVNAYTLTFAVLLLTGAALGDRFGRRRMFALGLFLFTGASAAAAPRRRSRLLLTPSTSRAHFRASVPRSSRR